MSIAPQASKTGYLTRNIWLVGFISLFTDMASEMLYPVMPLYLKEAGYGILFIGVLEGLAEAIAGLSKGYFGQWSDNLQKRVPFIQTGYSLSALSKPMLVLFQHPAWVLFCRSTDRLGKGIRTAPRDAYLSAQAVPEQRGRIFGFHRSMDTVGAFAGPLLGLIFLYFRPGDYYWLFLLAFFPGLLSIGFTFLLKEEVIAEDQIKKRPGILESFGYWKKASTDYQKLVIGLLAFALVNSSDIFLLLYLKESGLPDYQTLLMYILYNLIYALTAYPMGLLSDKLGRKNIFILGLILFAACYGCLGFSNNILAFGVVFGTYGLYAAATEGIGKAWLSVVCQKQEVATAFGFFTSLQSIATLLASSLAGLVWKVFGSKVLLMGTSVAAICIVIYFLLTLREEK